MGLFDNKFVPSLNEENSDYGWFNLNDLPNDLLPACLLMFKEKKDELEKFIEKNRE